LRNTDQWSAIATMLGNLIAKYADELDIGSISADGSSLKNIRNLKANNNKSEKTIAKNKNI